LVIQGERDWQEHVRQGCGLALAPHQEPRNDFRTGLAEIITNFEADVWAYTLRFDPYRKSGLLQVNCKAMAELRSQSAVVGSQREWEPVYKSVGEKLMAEILTSNPVFHGDLRELICRVGSRQNIMIEFIVGRGIYDVALEALYDSGESQHWMLLSPIYRRLNSCKEERPLFGDEPLSFLIIESDAHGPVPGMCDPSGQNVQLDRLQQVEAEGRTLRQYLEGIRKAPGAVPIGRIEHVRQPAPGQSLWGTVKALARSTAWDVVHYIGHSCHQREGGFVFFPADPFPERVCIEEFSRVLKRPRLLFLGSCHSSGAAFVYDLAAQYSGGAVVGFRWEIDDAAAAEYARRFYAALFESEGPKGSLEIAFFEACRGIRLRNRESRAWATPILVRV
jgi:hypothetical protein